jgi:hypothetical protein
MIAAVLYLRIGARARSGLPCGHVQRCARAIDGADSDAWHPTGPQVVECLGQHLFGVADDVIDLRHGDKARRVDLCGAARDDQLRVRIFATQPANGLSALAHGLGGDRAGIDDDGVVKPRFGGAMAHRLGLEGVEPAAEGNHARTVDGPLPTTL